MIPIAAIIEFKLESPRVDTAEKFHLERERERETNLIPSGAKCYDHSAAP